MSDLYGEASVEATARHLDPEESLAGPRALPRGPGVNVFRTSYAQERLWFLEQVAGGTAAYNVAGVFEATGRLDVRALRASFDAVARRHEALRTTFATIDGHPMQIVSPSAPIGFAFRELGTLAAGALSDAIRREIERPFDVARGPLVRLRVFARGQERSVVILTMHHLVADAWSVGLLVEEVTTEYRARLRGASTAPRPSTLQYADYSEWQRERASTPRTEEWRRYWRSQLADAPYPAVATGDRLRFRGAVERCELGAPLAQALRRAARRAGVTPFVVALAAWKIALRRWARLDDVTVLSPVANRERSELADVMGFFVNLVAFRTRLDGDPTITEVVRRVGIVVREGMRHQGLPFELVLGALGIDRTLARPPLSPFAFALERALDDAIELPGVTLTMRPVEAGASRTDVALIVTEHARGATVRLEYDRSLHAPDAMRTLVRDFLSCLEVVMQDPERRLSSLEPAVASSCEVVEPSRTVWAGFAAQARRTPQASAVRAGLQTVTYERLHAEAAQVAAALVADGIGRDVVVAIHAPRGIRWITGLLGIWGAGAVYLPLDPHWPVARARQVLERSRARVVLFDGEPPAGLVEWAEAVQGRCLVRLEDHGDPTAPSAAPGADSGDVAYVLYTSGSTGEPKGALIEHAGLANHLAAKIALLALGPEDVVAQTAAQSFDVSLWQCTAPLLVGGEVVIVDDATATDPTALLPAVDREGVTVLEVVPSVLQLVLDAVAPLATPGLRSLRWLIATGEPLVPELCRRWLARYPNVPIVNAYGPTECADDVTHHVVRMPPPGDAVRIPIGCPIPGMTIEVVDTDLHPVPSGTVGELCVSGIGVARGYLGDPERTAASFVRLPQSGADAASARRAYRTGDRGRRLVDGTFEILGRLDTQLKLGGVRVEPEEIEAVLCAHPAVRCAVVVPEPGDAPARLVAHVEVDGDTPAVDGTLRAWLAERVPGPMVPARFELRTVWPLTPHGKLDRRALTGATASAAPVQSRPPTGATECVLATLWREVLGVDVDAVDAGFFTLGGDSLATIRLVASARRHGLVFTPQDVFEHQTIAALACVARVAPVALAEQGLVVGDFEPTPIQRLFLGADLPRPDHYNMAMLLAVDEILAPSSMTVAVEHLMRHHDVLRLRARRDDAGWHTTIAGVEGPVPYAHVDLSTLDERAASAAIEAAADEAQASLELAHGPVLRVVSFALEPGRGSRLLLVVHHLACDAASWPMLLEDLATVYRQVEDGEPIGVPPKTTSYRAWAACLATRATSEAGGAEASAWEDDSWTGGVQLPRKPCASAAAPRVDDMVTLRTELDAATTTRLLAATARLGVTMESVLLMGLVLAATRDAREDRLVAYLERHGRDALGDAVDVSRTVGWFTAVFPVAVHAAASRRPRDTVVEIDRRLRAVPKGGMGWALQRHAARTRAGGRTGSATPEVSCNYLGRVDPPAGLSWRMAPESPGREVGSGGMRPTALDVVGCIAGGRLQVAWHYDSATYAATVIGDVADAALELVRMLADEADTAGRAA